MQHNKQKNELKKLIKKSLQGKTTGEEELFLSRYYFFFDNTPNITDTLTEQEKQKLGSEMLEVVIRQNTQQNAPLYRIWRRHTRWAAAAMLLLLLTGTLLYQHYYTSHTTIAKTSNTDRPPATHLAHLILADGSMVMLDSNANSRLPDQGAVQLSIKNGQLQYKGSEKSMLYNTVAIPKGGNYRLTLSDGTKVWLNAASNLRFPAAFATNERKVILDGEAYFEVAKGRTPFRVIAAGKGEVEVLGTHFNINAYPGQETVKATLLEGSVKVFPLQNGRREAEQAIFLKPGQQAEVTSGSAHLNNNIVIDEIMSWKNGMFYFESTPLETILAEFANWYDVDIVYQCSKEVKERRFFMIINRNVSLREVLKYLQASNITFMIEDKKLIVR